MAHSVAVGGVGSHALPDMGPHVIGQHRDDPLPQRVTLLLPGKAVRVSREIFMLSQVHDLVGHSLHHVMEVPLVLYGCAAAEHPEQDLVLARDRQCLPAAVDIQDSLNGLLIAEQIADHFIDDAALRVARTVVLIEGWIRVMFPHHLAGQPRTAEFAQ